MPNIEIKARIDNLTDIRDMLKDIELALATDYLGTLNQKDIYYKVPNGRLKLRISEDGSCLIPYVRTEELGIKKSNYCLLKADNMEECENILSQMFEIDIIVKKVREVFLIDNVRIHLDDVESLGSFIEFEAVYKNDIDELENRKRINYLLSIFKIKEESLIKCSYKDLLEKF